MSESPAHTEDHYLGGKVVLRQPRRGYRAGIDAALLASSLGLKPGAKALELGCGAGAALLSAAIFFPHCKVKGVERDPDAAHLAQTNIVLNDLEDRVWVSEGDALTWKGREPYDAVFFNPPYFEDASAMRAPAEEKTAAWMSDAPLKEWIRAAIGNLKPKGAITFIHRADRLDDALSALRQSGAGSVVIRPVQPRLDKPAKRILVRAIHQGRAPLRLMAPLVMHDESGEKYSAFADAILTGNAHIDLT